MEYWAGNGVEQTKRLAIHQEKPAIFTECIISVWRPARGPENHWIGSIPGFFVLTSQKARASGYACMPLKKHTCISYKPLKHLNYDCLPHVFTVSAHVYKYFDGDIGILVQKNAIIVWGLLTAGTPLCGRSMTCSRIRQRSWISL